MNEGSAQDQAFETHGHHSEQEAYNNQLVDLSQENRESGIEDGEQSSNKVEKLDR